MRPEKPLGAAWISTGTPASVARSTTRSGVLPKTHWLSRRSRDAPMTSTPPVSAAASTSPSATVSASRSVTSTPRSANASTASAASSPVPPRSGATETTPTGAPLARGAGEVEGLLVGGRRRHRQ